MSETSPEQVEAKRRQGTLGAWWMLAVLFSLYTISFVDRSVITIMVPDIQKSLQLSDMQIGLILGPAFAVAYSVFGLPLGWVADRYNRRWVIFIGAAGFGLATGISGLVGSFAGLLLARIFIGIGEASLTPAAYSLMADRFPRSLFGTASAIYNSAIKIGTAGALALGGVAIGLFAGVNITLPGLGPLEPWRLVFLAVGAFSLLLAFMVFTFPEPARTRMIPRGGGARTHNLFTFLKAEQGVLVPLLLGFSLVGVCSFALTSWAPTYIGRRFGWEPAHYGPVLGAISVAAALTLIIKGAIVDWLYTRGGKDASVRFYTWLLMGCAPIAAMTFFVPSTLLFFVCFGIVQVIIIPTAVFVNTAIQLITPGNLRGQMMAVTLFCISVIGGSIGPVAVASLTQYVFRDEDMVGYSMAVVLCTAIPVALVLLRCSLAPLRRAVEAVEAASCATGSNSHSTQ